jgi:hypothetical protein
MNDKLIILQPQAKLAGLNINVNNTKEMRINAQMEEKLSIANKEIEQVESFTYLGSIVTQDGGTEQDMPTQFVRISFMWCLNIVVKFTEGRKTKL